MDIFEILLLPIVSVVTGFGLPCTIIFIRNLFISCEKFHIIEKILYSIIGIIATVAYAYAQYKLKGILVVIASSVVFIIIYLICRLTDAKRR